MDYNHVTLGGRLVRDPELRETPGGTSVADVSVAVNRYYRDSNDESQEETSYFDITVWGRQAENVDKYLSKGSQVVVGGRLKQDRWENDEGDKRSKVKVVASTVQFVGGADGPGKSGGSSNDDDDDDYDDIPF